MTMLKSISFGFNQNKVVLITSLSRGKQRAMQIYVKCHDIPTEKGVSYVRVRV